MIEAPKISTTDMIETDKLEAPENFRASPPANGLLGSVFPDSDQQGRNNVELLGTVTSKHCDRWSVYILGTALPRLEVDKVPSALDLSNLVFSKLPSVVSKAFTPTST